MSTRRSAEMQAARLLRADHCRFHPVAFSRTILLLQRRWMSQCWLRKFRGLVTLSANRSLAVGSGGVIYGNSTIGLNAPYVAIGTAFHNPFAPQEQQAPFLVLNQPFHFAPHYGSGVLNVSGDLIDVGNLSLQGVGELNLTATNGDVRGDGTLDGTRFRFLPDRSFLFTHRQSIRTELCERQSARSISAGMEPAPLRSI